jgi:Putative lumazine-binding
MMRQEVLGVRRLKAAVPDSGPVGMMMRAGRPPPVNNNIVVRENRVLMHIRKFAFMVLSVVCSTGASHAADPRDSEVMKPIQRFFTALAKRDKAGLVAEVVPDAEVMSLRKGELRRLTVEELGDRIVAFQAGDIAESISRPVVHVDNDLGVVWAPYEFTVNGRVDHCGTDVINLMKLHDRWMIVGLADNEREKCR